MDHLRKVQSGQKLEIPAATFNAFVDAARDFKDRQRNKQSKPEPYFPDSGIILVANQSGEDRNRFDVLGVTEPIIRPEAPRNKILRMQLFTDDVATPWIGYRENWVRRVSYTQCKSAHSGECICHGSPIIVDAAVRVPAEGSENPEGPGYGYEYYDCDQETWHTAENVAVSGLVELTGTNILLNVRNTSSYQFTVGGFLLSAKREGRIP